MRKTLAFALVLGLTAGGALAQTPAPANGPQNSAVNTSDSSNRVAAGPVKGANSFTESEARSRIEKNGFTNVGALKKDDDGIWRGMGTRNGQQVAVALDYQGNVFFGDAARAMNGQTMPGHNGNAASGSSAR
jgi:GTP-dependent phosphoenolpyruvate carboxykinase